MRIAIVPCLGLGDGLISLTLAHNLSLAGLEPVVYHPILPELQELFPHIQCLPRERFEPHERTYFFWEKLEWMQEVMREVPDAQKVILNPIATPNTDYPFWEVGKFDGRIPLVHNLVAYCKKEFGIEDAVTDNGLTLTTNMEFDPKRVILHPTSSRAGKNWSKSKYLQLADALCSEGFDPVFILSEQEQWEWPEVVAPIFDTLVELTHFVAGASIMVGNDSGIGHLASNVGVPTVTICRSKMAADFWRPAFGPGEVIFPPSWVPNLKGLRLRDKRWQDFVGVKRVLKALHTLQKEYASV